MTPTSPLISAATLREQLAGSMPPRVFDAGFDLADTSAGERAFGEAHLPGSRYIHLDRDLSTTKSGRNGRHPLPSRAAFAATAGRLGIAPGTSVVVLDRQGGMYAARVWWMLRWLGHAEVSVLDGGLAAWLAAGGETVASASPAPASAPPYPEHPSLVGSVDAQGLAGMLGKIMVLDARSPERYRGEKEPIDPVAGRIPGAFNRFHAGNMADGRFKPAEVLRGEFEALLGGRAPDEVVHSCGSGVTACHNLLAMEHAGLSGSRLYPGSWSEWSSDPTRPIARG